MKVSQLLYKEDLLEDIKYKGDIEISDVTSCVDEITPNSLFVFLNSINFNIELIINDVLKKKPAMIVCEASLKIESSEIEIIRVRSARRAIALIYARFNGIDFNKIKFIGITGTNGKTTTASLIYRILSASNNSVGFIGTGKIEINGKIINDKNYSMTTPDPKILYKAIKAMENEGCEFIVAEISSHSLYFEKVAAIPFEIGIFTNLSPEHLDFHKSMEDYYATKLKLFDQCKTGIFNMDDPYSKRAYYECTCSKIRVGILNDAEIKAQEIALHDLEGSEYIYSEPGLIFKTKIRLPGAYNVYNSLLAISAIRALGINACVAKDALKTVGFIEGRMEIINDEIKIIIDYAHTTEAFTNTLRTLRGSLKENQKLITVFGCGGDRDRSKRPIMAKASEIYSDIIFVTTDNSRTEPEFEIIADIIKGFSNPQKTVILPLRADAIQQAILRAKNGDIVAIIGKGHERYNIDKSGYHDFDERSIIQDALKKRKGGFL